MPRTRREFLAAAAGSLTAAGCSPQTPPAPAEPKRKSVIERSFVLDLHCDTPSRISAGGFDLGKRNDYGQVDIPRMREGGVSGIFFSVYMAGKRGPTPWAFEQANAIIDEIEAETARHPDDLVLAASASDIVAAKQKDKIAVLLGIEGGHMIDSSLDNLRRLYERGGRYMTLTHARHTPWAGSSGDSPDEDPGLTEFGREVVAEMNRLGMMVDVSHVSDKTFADVMEVAAKPVIASHSSCRALASHPRNMTDEMIRAVAESGGAVHINYYSSFLDDDHRARSNELVLFDQRIEQARVELADEPKELAAAEWRINMEKVEHVGRPPFDRLLDHFDHAAKVAGVEHVGLGSDFDGVSEQLPEDMEDISKIPNLVDGLSGRGFSDDDIEKILGGNTMRVMRANVADAEQG